MRTAPARLWRGRGLFRRDKTRCMRAGRCSRPHREALPSQSYLNIGAIIAARHQAEPARFIPVTAFSPRTRVCAGLRDAGLVLSVRRRNRSKRWATRPAKEIMRPPVCPACPAIRARPERRRHASASREDRLSLMIKAVAAAAGAACGCCGCRHISDALRGARSEALGAFGDAIVILERAISNPATSKSRCSAMPSATPSISASAIARCSGGIKN